MIIDLTVSNFRSFPDEQVLSMFAENGRGRHPSNYKLIEDERIAVVRSCAIFGANASGKSNILRALAALKWLVVSSAGRQDGQRLLTYEPFRLSSGKKEEPVRFEIEFVVQSGERYRYEISFNANQILTERMFSFSKRSRATMFERNANDTWETMKLGGTYKGGARRFPFFDNAAYLSRAGNDASAPPSIREIYRYFQRLSYVAAGSKPMTNSALSDAPMMRAVSELICLADTGVTKVTLEENESVDEIRLPDGIPEEVKEAILADNRFATKYWVRSDAGDLVDFAADDMSSGTVRLVELLPVIINALKMGSVIVVDEIDAHLHTDMIFLILSLFHDNDVNAKGAQIILSTHDTNILDSGVMRRDQIWFVTKVDGVSSLRSLDEYEKKYVRPDSPFESFYREGRLGALPRLSHSQVKKALLDAFSVIGA
jgi:AAA15 family ATPase/GTPase